MERHRLRAYIILFFVYAIWGFSTPIIKFTLGGVSPLLFLFYRFLISSIAAFFIFLFTGFHFPKDNQTRLILIVYGILSTSVSLGLLFFGLENTTALDSTLITLAAPLLISAAGVVYLKEHVTNKEKLGMGIALVGTILTVLGPLTQAGEGGKVFSGNLLTFLYLLVTIIPSIQAKILLRKNITPIMMTNLSFILGFLTIAPFVVLKYSSIEIFSMFTSLSFPYFLGILYMALLSGTLAYFLSNEAQKTIEVGEASVFTYLYPIFTTPLAILWLGEKITPYFVVGAIIIGIGVMIAEFKKTRYNKASS